MAAVIDIDEADVTVLQENMEKASGLCTSIHNSLVKLSNKSLQAEQRIRPLVSDTTKLNLYKSNIEQCLALVDDVRIYAAQAAEKEQLLNDQQVMYTAGVAKYISLLKEARDLLVEVNHKSLGEFKGIINSIKSAIRMGELNLNTYFELSINKSSGSFDPQKIMSANEPFPYLEPNQIAEYKTILSYFAMAGQPADNKLIDGRSKQVVGSMAIMEPFTKPESRASNINYERGSNGINNYTQALLCFIGNEKSLFQEFYEDKYSNYYYPALEAEMNNYNKIIKSLISFVQANSISDGYLAFELVDSLSKIMKETPMDSPYYSMTKKNLDTTRLLTQSVFLDFIKGIDMRYEKVQSIPSDSSVNDVIVDTMSRLRRMGDYRAPALVAISGMKPGSWIPMNPSPIWSTVYSSVPPSAKSITEGSDPKALLSCFFSDAIDAILISLEVKAKQFLKRSSLGYFMMTNYFVCESIIQRSEIQKSLGSLGQERLARLKKRFLGFFLENWRKAAAHLMDVTIINTDKSSQSKEKDIIKEKFRKFNEEFEELVRIHKSFRITDSSVRKYLNTEISFIIPLYHRFHDKYAGDYFKHTDKYVKWNNQQFDQLVKSL